MECTVLLHSRLGTVSSEQGPYNIEISVEYVSRNTLYKRKSNKRAKDYLMDKRT